jgi:hypothetical protein
MKHRRVVTVAFAALLSLSLIGVGAASASADTYKENGAITFKGTNTQKFKTPNGTVECKRFSGKGNVKGAGTEAEATNIEYSECKAFGVAATINFNGCTFIFNAPVNIAKTVEDPKHQASVAIKCPAGKTIVVETPVCEVKVPEQGLGKEETFKEEIITENEKSPVKIAATVTGIKGESKGGACPGGAQKFATGEYTGKSEATNIEIVS